jgi:membrane protein YdbS with pleckstrin-like domain
MGSIVKFARPRPLLRRPPIKTSAEQEWREARRSLFILTGSFFVTATVICAVVVAMVSSTWTDVLIMSAFVLVFALLKIGLANALIYTMLRYDAEATNVPVQTGAVRSDRRFAPIRQAPVAKGRRSRVLKISKLRAASTQPGSPAPH